MLPASSTAFSDSWAGQDQYVDSASVPPPGGAYPNIYQRLGKLGLSGWRVLGDTQYEPQITVNTSPVNFYLNASGKVTYFPAWYFTALDKQLSEVPRGVLKVVQQQPPYSLFYCAKGSWTSATTGCNIGGFPPGALIDQSYRQLAGWWANVVKYFRTGVLASGSGSTSYTSRTLTDTRRSFTGDKGDCVTATVIDDNGFPDWVTGTVAAVGGTNDHTITLTGSWSPAESYDRSVGRGSMMSIATPAPGAAYNLASCRPPSGLTRPQYATPWPRPPSVGNVDYFEINNEPDLSQDNLAFLNPTLPAPTPNLTGVHVTGGTLTPGSRYTYEIASSGSQGNLSMPGTEASITLPAGDNAVEISWSATVNDDLKSIRLRDLWPGVREPARPGRSRQERSWRFHMDRHGHSDPSRFTGQHGQLGRQDRGDSGRVRCDVEQDCPGHEKGRSEYQTRRAGRV